PTAVHRRRELARMRRVLVAADAVVMNTPEAARVVRDRFPELRGRPVVAIPNGYDAEDFAAPLEPRDDGRFRIAHTGYLHTALGLRHRARTPARPALGGAVRGLDILPRSHVVLLDALAELASRRPELAAQVDLVLAGVLSPDDERAVRDSPV